MVALDAASYLTADFCDTLMSLGANRVRKTFPWADTVLTRPDIYGNPVTVPDISKFFTVTFDSKVARDAALTSSTLLRHVIAADSVSVSATTSPNLPRDPLILEDWPCQSYQPKNPGWPLFNTGERTPQNHCFGAGIGIDAGMSHLFYADGTPWFREFQNSPGFVVVVDTGVRDSHGDLRPLLSPTDGRKSKYQRHPLRQACLGHGTAMSGLLGAIADNGEGGAGTCPGCGFLDVEASACPDAYCQSLDGLCRFISGYAAYLHDDMFTDFAPRYPVSVNMSFAGTGDASASDFTRLYRLYKQNVVLVASSADRSFAVPTDHGPINAPFVLGVGGHTWDGEFWDKSRSCTIDNNGNPDTESGTAIGTGMVDICAPASWRGATTSLLPTSCTPQREYTLTDLACSGATALTAGAIAWLSNANTLLDGGPLSADDLMGIVTASGTPFTHDPTQSNLGPGGETIVPTCASCPRRMYGRGRLNVQGAYRLLLARDQWRTQTIDGIYGTGTGTFIQSYEEYGETFAVGDTTWQVYKLTVDVRLPSWVDEFSGEGDYELPGYIFWIRAGQSAGYPLYFTDPGIPDALNYRNRVAMIHDGVHWAGLEEWPGTGYPSLDPDAARLVTYSYRWRVGTTAWHWKVAPENLRIEYVVIDEAVAAVNEADRYGAALRILWAKGEDGGAKMRIHAPAGSMMQCELFDVGGRGVAATEANVPVSGLAEVRIEGSHRLTSGIYFERVTAGGQTARRRLVIIK